MVIIITLQTERNFENESISDPENGSSSRSESETFTKENVAPKQPRPTSVPIPEDIKRSKSITDSYVTRSGHTSKRPSWYDENNKSHYV